MHLKSYVSVLLCLYNVNIKILVCQIMVRQPPGLPDILLHTCRAKKWI